ncbi:MAG TPA: hypothetical protein VEP89_06505 [Draconibacterium sp.]|nr:hypothetical protein [Draconibacterium sp.]
MKRICPFIAFLFISYFSFAQYENFDLSKYKLPEIKRHQLDFDFNSNGYFQNSTYYYDNDMGEKSESENNRFLGGGELEYSFYQNTGYFKSQEALSLT